MHESSKTTRQVLQKFLSVLFNYELQFWQNIDFSHMYNMLCISLTVNILGMALVIQLSSIDRVFLGNCKDSAAYKAKGKQYDLCNSTEISSEFAARLLA